MRTIANILVPLDFSPPSDAALSFAADLARRYEASLHLLHVFQPTLYALPEGNRVPSAELIEQIENGLTSQLQTAKLDALANGVQHVGATLLRDAPVAAILRFARENNFDLIVMGTHGRTGLKRLAIGSVAERTVRHAPCPVLTIRAPESS